MKSHDFARLLLTQPDLEIVFGGDGCYNFMPTGEFEQVNLEGTPGLLVETNEDDRATGTDEEEESE